ncbi:MAG: hypothetical protein ACTSYC_08125, partial [Promethearchaeota archaeon]
PVEREAKEEVHEELTAKGLRLIDKEQGRVELVKNSEIITYIETPGEDVSLLENLVLLKNGKRDGLVDLVKIIENVKVSQDHDDNIESIGFSGKLNVENPSKKDRLWDINLVLKNIETTTFSSIEIKIQDLTEDKSTKYAEIGQKSVLLLPSSAQWHSSRWNIESEDYPQFRKSIEFRVLSDFQTSVNSTILIKDVELLLASIKGQLTYDVAEIELPVEEEEGVVKIPTYDELIIENGELRFI